MSDKCYEDLSMIIKKQQKQEMLNIAIMDSGDSCAIGTLKLGPGELIIAEHLRTGYFKNIKLEGGTAVKDEDTYAAPVKAGDKVLVCKMQGERYAVIGRL